MKKKILFLGIGNAQIDGIAYLKSLGHKIIAAANSPNGRALSLVDVFHEIDISHRDALCQLAYDEKVDYVCSIGSDIGALAAAEISERIGLTALPPFSTFAMLNDKVQFRNFLSDNSLPCPIFKEEKIDAKRQRWDKFPAVVKPANSQGQRGVSIVENPSELKEAVARALTFSKEEKVIMEEYIAGHEVSVLLFLENGKISFSAVIDRETIKPFAGGVVKKHRYPSFLADALQGEIIDLSMAIAVKAGVSDGPFYLQIITTPNGPVPVEAAARLDGCHLWRLIKMATGADLLAANFHLLLGDREKAAELLQCRVIKPLEQRFFHQKPGEIVKNDPALKEGALFLDFYCDDGTVVPAINGVMEKTGYAIYPDEKELD